MMQQRHRAPGHCSSTGSCQCPAKRPLPAPLPLAANSTPQLPRATYIRVGGWEKQKTTTKRERRSLEGPGAREAALRLAAPELQPCLKLRLGRLTASHEIFRYTKASWLPPRALPVRYRAKLKTAHSFTQSRRRSSRAARRAGGKRRSPTKSARALG